ncbi:MAG TPA: dihydroxy-acid dehydratase, partial [Spirochaetales bacterium]|nr:dihydroxy-acid dehydratase [Spirochaetales bacterium]
GGEIALVQEGDPILIDIPSRKIELQVDEKTLQKRRKEEEARGKKAYRPHTRDRKISAALRAYAHFAASADVGAVRVIPETE